MPPAPSLAGRIALVTGVSRPTGIGFAVANRLHELGATVTASGWPTHDATQSWGERPLPTGLPFEVAQHDVTDPTVPAAMIDEVVDRHGGIDIVVAAHAVSSDGSLADVTAADLDGCWAANVRSVVLLAQRFANRHAPAASDEPPRGRMIWFTSGQHRSPMSGELAYALSKGALHQMTATIDRSLAEARIVANCINPGPVDTGWASSEVRDFVARRFPDGRWTSPADTAELVAFLVGDAGAVIRGQVVDAESGFDRFG